MSTVLSDGDNEQWTDEWYRRPGGRSGSYTEDQHDGRCDDHPSVGHQGRHPNCRQLVWGQGHPCIGKDK